MHAQQSNTFRLTYDLDGRAKTAEYSQPRVVLGRSPDCDLVIFARDVSRMHAAIERDPDGWRIVDLGSRYGTYVNHERVTSHRLNHGDQIALGGGTTVLEFEVGPGSMPGESRVLFDSGAEKNKIRMTIAVEELERPIGAQRDRGPLAELAAPTTATAPSGGPATPAAAAGREASAVRPDVPLVSLFKQIGEVLLTSENLDDMLDKVLNVAMSCFPAQRGFICLCDETAESIVPKAARIKGLSQGESISISRSIAREALRSRQALLVDNAPADQRFALARSVLNMDIRAAMCAPLYHAGRVEGLIYLDTRDADHPFVARHLELLAALSSLTAVGILQARLRDEFHREKAITSRLARYSSPRVVEQIVASLNTPDGTMLATQSEVTVLFADLSGFTTFAESRQPAEVVAMLNRAFEHLTRAIFQYDGTLDKFLGDGLLAVFGAPVPQADHAERAVRAAILMQQLLAECNLTDPRGDPISMRVGIHSGTAVAGDIGAPVRKDYTVVGDVVNVASRLQSSVAAPGQIVIGPTTYELCKHAVECESLPEIRLKGKQQSVRPYLVLRLRADTVS